MAILICIFLIALIFPSIDKIKKLYTFKKIKRQVNKEWYWLYSEDIEISGGQKLEKAHMTNFDILSYYRKK